jgi:hypothetical protein
MGSDGLDGKSMADAREALEALAQDHFEFVVADVGFARGPTERSASLTAYSYKNRHQTAQIGVQTLLDFGGQFVEVSLVRLESGKWPKLGQRENHSRVVRIALVTLLRDVLLIKDAQLDQAAELARTKRPWDARLAAQMLDTCHDLLARYSALVLQQPIDVLFPPHGKARL